MSRLPLFLALLSFFVLGAALIARVPLAASPDEPAHWQYIEYLAVNHKLPVFEGQPPPEVGYEFHQPPLYYALAAPGWAILPAGVQNYWARAVSLLCGLATLIFIWKSARLLLPNERSVATIATGLAALWPLHLGVSAGANNDALGGLWAAALFWVGARVLLRGASLRDAALVGLFVGLGALTKNTVLLVGAATLVALLLAPRTETKAPSRALALAVALATLAIVAGPLWARNTLVYGDPLTLRLFSEAAATVSPGLSRISADPFTAFVYWRFMFWLLGMTAWGFFGGVNSAIAATKPLNPDGPIVGELWMAPLIALCFLAPVAALFGLRRLDIELTPPQKRVLWFFAVGFALVFAAWLKFAYDHFAGGQARYLHAALLPMCVMLALGWRGLWGDGRALKWASLVFGALLVGLTLLNVLVWKTLV